MKYKCIGAIKMLSTWLNMIIRMILQVHGLCTFQHGHEKDSQLIQSPILLKTHISSIILVWWCLIKVICWAQFAPAPGLNRINNISNLYHKLFYMQFLLFISYNLSKKVKSVMDTFAWLFKQVRKIMSKFLPHYQCHPN